MKRLVTVMAALGLVAGACGSGDDDAANDDAAVEESAPEESTDVQTDDDQTDDGADADTDTDDDDGADTDTDTDTDTDDTDTDDDDGDNDDQDDSDDADDQDDGADGDDDADDDGDDDGDSVESGPIRSIDDVPAACRDQMSSMLRQMEPIVSGIDWETASLADLEAITADVEAIAPEFGEGDVSGCDDMNFVDDNEIELMIQFAEDEAPGTVGFLRFIDDIRGSFDNDDDAVDDSSAGGSEGFADCDEAIAFIEAMLADYDSALEVPASEFLKFSGLTNVVMTCTPEQLEILDSDEFNDFLSGG